MIFINAIIIGLKEIWSHRFRSLLTMLGIVLGVASLVTMAAIVKGMENSMKESLIAMGGLDKVRITRQSVPAEQSHLADQAVGITLRDVHALQASAPLISLVSPDMELNRARISRNGKIVRPSDVIGVIETALEMNLYELEHGRFFTDLDEELANPVCVIGTGIRDELFGSPEETGEPIIPIGEQININNQPFTIVGMFKHYESTAEKLAREAAAKQVEEDDSGGVKRQKGWRSRRWDAFWRKNNMVYMPLNTMWIKFLSSNADDPSPDPRLSEIDIKIRDIEMLEPALQQAKNVLMMTHKGIEDFSIRTQESEVDDIDTRIRNARLSGGIIAALSLMVGGIGIMNIMLASINERIREIGTCKAIGATGMAIFVQILVESAVLAVLGALAGLVASFGLVEIVASMSTASAAPSYTDGGSVNIPVITWQAMAIAVAFSTLVGLIAGFLPAIKAANLNPIQALRYE